MNQLLPGKKAGKPRILVAPLDWGLGHATRCIPIIRELMARGAEVLLAGEGVQEQLLTEEFPGLPFLHLPGYRIRYARTARGLTWKMIWQGPKLSRAIRAEHTWLKKAVDKYQIDAVISDNRYGLHHAIIPCIFITHQLLIKSSAGRWTENILQKRNYRYISRFTECWVPDTGSGENLAGELSHPVVLPPVPVRYIGHLSRFTQKQVTERKGHLLFILSGPEPQRSLLEDTIINEISHYNGTATVLRGLPGNSSFIPSTGMISFYNHVSAAALNEKIQEAAFIISRSGYSTVMDAIPLQKKCIFIPTPGQTEQEYLGRYLMKKGMAFCISQKEFTLAKALGEAEQFGYIPWRAGGNQLAETIRAFLDQVAAPALG